MSHISIWMADEYGKAYAPNTRETIRRYTLHQFMEMGLVLLNPDDPGRPTNSPKNVYQIEPSALGVLRTFGAPAWDGKREKYLASVAGRNRLRKEAARCGVSLYAAGWSVSGAERDDARAG